MQKIKYITNRELLAELQRSKATYCHFTGPEYVNYDAVVTSTDALTPELLTATLQTKLNRLAKSQMPVDDITTADVVFRVMADNHLPEETDEKRRKKSSSGGWIPRTPFPPFQHFVLHDDLLIEVGRSHWQGDLETGAYCIMHGKMTNRLASMFLLLVERYSKGSSWRNYCVDEQTEALTQRGWLGIDDIREDDTVLSYLDDKLTWSTIKSIYRNDYEGKMFHLTMTGMDALVTPGHKFVTTKGIKPVEYLLEKDKIVLTGEAEPDAAKAICDLARINIFSGPSTASVAELDFHGGKRNGNPNEPTIDYNGRVWCLETEYGSFMVRRNGYNYLTGNSYVSEMKGQALVQLSQVGLQFDESRSDNPFAWYTQIIKNCLSGDTMILTREFGSVPISHVAEQDVHLLDGNGEWVKSHIYDYGEQETINLNFFGEYSQCSIRSTMDHGWIEQDTGKKITTAEFVNNPLEMRETCIDDLRRHLDPGIGERRWKIDPDRQDFERRMERVYCPDVPTTHSFSLASGIHSSNCFRRILLLEKRNQDIRDDLLIMAGAVPSYTRQVDDEIEQKQANADAASSGEAEKKVLKKRGRKPKVRE